MFEVSFERSNGEEIILETVSTMEKAYNSINKFLEDHNYESHYMRQWYDKTKDKLKIDVGSWSEFFYIKNLDGKPVD